MIAKDIKHKSPSTYRNVFKTERFPEYLDSIEVDSIQFRGRPKQMKAQVWITNPTKDTVWIQNLEFIHTKKVSMLGFPSTIRVNTRLNPGQTKSITLRSVLPASISKGTYNTKLQFGKKTIPVSFNVSNQFVLSIHPRNFITQGVRPEGEYEFIMEISNLGNVDYIIPKLGHSLLLDTQYKCKAESWSVMNDAKNGEQAYSDGVYKKVMEKYAFWVELSLVETGKMIKAGESNQIHLKLKLPKNININACYSGDVAIVGKQIIKYQILG